MKKLYKEIAKIIRTLRKDDSLITIGDVFYFLENELADLFEREETKIHPNPIICLDEKGLDKEMWCDWCYKGFKDRTSLKSHCLSRVCVKKLDFNKKEFLKLCRVE